MLNLLKVSPKELRSIVEKELEETSNWKLSDWRNYQAEKFDQLKKTEWTKKTFPELVNVEYDDLGNLKPRPFPVYPPGFPSAIEAKTTGTVRQKIVKFSPRDLQDTLKVLFKILLTISEGIGQGKLFMPVGGREYGTGVGARMYSMLGWDVYAPTVSEFRDKSKMDKIAKKGPFKFFSGMPIFVMRFLDMYGEQVLAEGDILFLFGGDLLYDSILRRLNEIAKDTGRKFRIHNLYVSTETMMMGVSLDPEKPNDIHLLPDLNILHIGDEEKRVNLFDVKSETEGNVYPTILRDLVIPLYDIGDVIKFIGVDRNLPVFNVLGRKAFETVVEHPSIGELKGYWGAFLRASGIPINTTYLDKALSPLTSNYLLVFYSRGDRVRMVLYSEKDISPEFVKMQLLKYPELGAIVVSINAGVIEVETKKVDLDPAYLTVKGKPPVKLPRVLVVPEK